jgi:hypothetical protein
MGTPGPPAPKRKVPGRHCPSAPTTPATLQAPAQALGTDWLPLVVTDAGVTVGQSGSTLTTNADILVMPARRLGVVVLINANPIQLLGLSRGAADIALDVLRLRLGQAPVASSPSVHGVYLVVDLLLAVFGLLLLIHAWRARTWPDRLARARHRRWFEVRTLVADLMLPVVVLLGVPLAIGATGSTRFGDLAGGWAFVLWTLPDIGAALLVLAIVPVVLGAWKLLATRRRGSPVPVVGSASAA